MGELGLLIFIILTLLLFLLFIISIFSNKFSNKYESLLNYKYLYVVISILFFVYFLGSLIFNSYTKEIAYTCGSEGGKGTIQTDLFDSQKKYENDYSLCCENIKYFNWVNGNGPLPDDYDTNPEYDETCKSKLKFLKTETKFSGIGNTNIIEKFSSDLIIMIIVLFLLIPIIKLLLKELNKEYIEKVKLSDGFVLKKFINKSLIIFTPLIIIVSIFPGCKRGASAWSGGGCFIDPTFIVIYGFLIIALGGGIIIGTIEFLIKYFKNRKFKNLEK